MFFMNHEVYCFQIRIPTRRFWAHKKIVSRKKETFLVIERVITNIGNYKHLARIFKLHKRFHGATEPIRNATGGFPRTESHIFCSHIFLTVVHPKLNNNIIKLVICIPQDKIRDSRNPQISAPLYVGRTITVLFCNSLILTVSLTVS
jgi:hypothetical protein